MCMIEQAERLEVIREAVPTARKPHTCGECLRTIAPGERYEVVYGRMDPARKIHTHKTCEHCLAARAWLSDECGGWVYEFVCEDLREHFTERDYESGGGYALGRLIVGMQRKWTRRDGVLMAVP